jgi:hypothetical protein
MMGRRAYGLLLLLTALGCTQAGESASEEVIRKAEANLILPKGADPLGRYDRFYVVTPTSVVGAFRSASAEGKITIVSTEDDLPFRADGGCSYIQVRFERASNSWTQVMCNGFA